MELFLIVIKSIAFLLIMSVLPFILGGLITNKMKSGRDSLALTFVSGIFIMLGSFYPIAVIMTLTGGSLTLLLVIWLIITVILAAVSIKTGPCILRLNIKNSDFIKKPGFIILICLALIVFQVIFVCIMQHTDADDATYVGMATTSYFTDSVNVYMPTTGAPVGETFYSYALAPFGVFFAMLGKLLALHPAIIMHSLMPVIFIPLAYVVYYKIGDILFKNKEKAALFLFFAVILTIFGNWSIRSISTFLLFRIWQGKAVLCSIIIPLIFYLMMKLKDEKETKADWALLILVSVCACAVSGMGPLLADPMLFVFMIIDIIQKRKAKRIIGYILAMLPCLILGIAYFAMSGIGD